MNALITRVEITLTFSTGGTQTFRMDETPSVSRETELVENNIVDGYMTNLPTGVETWILKGRVAKVPG